MGSDGRRSVLATREERRVPHPGWIVAGLAVLGIGLAGWYFLGPDVRRYIKIRNM